jgi:hypothetical protein
VSLHEYFQAINAVHKLSVKGIVADPHAALQKLDRMHKAIKLMDQAWLGDTLPELEAIADPAKRVKGYERIAKYDAPRKLREIANRANRAQQKTFRDELRQVVREAWGPVLDQLLTAKQQLRREIEVEFKRRWEDPAGIDPDEVAMAVHARLRPEVHIRLGYIKNMVKAICHRRWGL